MIEGRRYHFEKIPSKVNVVRQAPSIEGNHLFRIAQKPSGVGREILDSIFFITSKEKGSGDKEYAAVLEMPFHSLRLEHVLRALAIVPTVYRAVTTKEVVERLRELFVASQSQEGENWRILRVHAQKLSNAVGNSPSFSPNLENLCLRPEDIQGGIEEGSFVRFYKQVDPKRNEVLDGFLERLKGAIQDSSFIWNGKRIPSIEKTERLFSRLEQVGSGARERVIEKVVGDLSQDEIEKLVSAHAAMLNVQEMKTKGGKACYVARAQGVQINPLSSDEIHLTSPNSYSQVVVEDGPEGVEFDIRTKEVGDSLMIPVIMWRKDRFGFRHWQLGEETGVSRATVPVPSSKKHVRREMSISGSQYSSLLGLMVFDLLNPDIRNLIYERFGEEGRFEHPGMSVIGTLQRKEALIQSEVLKRAERYIAQKGEVVK